MAPTIESLGIDRLSLAERILLVEEIWDSIAAAHEANPKAGSSWEDVKARLVEHP